MNTLKKKIKHILVKFCQRLGETSPILMDFSSIEDGESAAFLLETMRAARYLSPKEKTVPENKRVLIIAPHPDDEVIGMGGTLVKMIARGCSVDVVYLTFGNDETARIEAKESADFLGYNCLFFFDCMTKSILLDEATLQKFAEEVCRAQPDVIAVPFMLDDHDDHRRASELLLRCAERKLLSSIGAATEVWAYQVYTMLPLNTVINITGVLDRKLDAIRKYKSRFKQRDWAHFVRGLNAFNIRYLHGNIKEDYAELFLSVSLRSYLKMCSTYFNDSKGNCYSTEGYKKL